MLRGERRSQRWIKLIRYVSRNSLPFQTIHSISRQRSVDLSSLHIYLIIIDIFPDRIKRNVSLKLTVIISIKCSY